MSYLATFIFLLKIMELGAFLIGTDLWTAGSASHAAVTYYTPELKDSSKDISILGGFMNNYTEHVIAPGAKNILPYCTRLLVILAVLQATWELSVKFMSGDKLQYLINMTLKIGFYLFLMTNWISLMGSLSEGFELLGIKASGGDAAANNIIGANCDRIVQLAIDCWAAIWQDVSFDSIGILLIMIIAMVAIVYCMFMTALEMFMARIEFYTMALLTLPLLAFGVTSKFSFLTEKAIGAMFNLAIKICAIASIAAMAVPFIESFIQKLKETPSTMDDLGVLLQAVLACGMIYILTKKIPALVTGLLSGSPQLGGSSMVEMARGAAGGVGAAAGAVGAVRAASAAADFARSEGRSSVGGGFSRGTLTQLGRNFAMSRSPVQSYRRSMQSFQSTLQNTGSRTLDQIRMGRDSNNASLKDGQSTSNDAEQSNIGDKTRGTK